MVWNGSFRSKFLGKRSSLFASFGSCWLRYKTSIYMALFTLAFSCKLGFTDFYRVRPMVEISP